MPEPAPQPDSHPHGESRPDFRRVTLCITELDPGGAEQALVRVAIGLQQLGWDVNVVSLRDAGSLAAPLNDHGINVTALGCGGFLDVRAVFRLRRLLAERQPDVLLCFLHQANMAGRFAGWLAGVKPVVSGIRVADRRWSVIRTDRWSRRLSHHYVAVSRHVADIHGELCGIPSNRMTVICNGVDIPSVRHDPASRDDESFRILFVGRLTEQKRPQDLVAAISRLPSDVLPQVTVDILGDGELRGELQQQISDSGLSDRVHLLGYCDNVTKRMVQSDVLVLPSAWEGLPNVVLEAMACGLPVIASNVDGVSEVLDDGTTGWLVPAGDVTALSEVIGRVSRDVDARRQVSAQAFEAVQQRFCWGSSIRQFDALLQRLIVESTDVEKST